MKNERGAAIAIVLLILGMVSLIAAGLMVQRQFDSYFTMAQTNYEKMFNMADGAALVAYTKVGIKESVGYQGGQTSETVYTSTGQGQDRVGSWTSRTILKGYDTDPSLLSGWELGTAEGYHVQFWVAEGTAARANAAGPAADSAVYIACNKYARNL
ncbi:MAG: hypothetical protein FJY85_03400 [Deltaproteobacteria bacterium]|nr:hypothetical protein [Deltaproteobacteria bacterium]